MSITTNPQEGESSDGTLAALSQALEEIARETKQNARPTEAIFESEDAAGKMQEPQMLDAIARRLPQRGALPLWSLIGGLLSLACIATIIFVWPSPDSRAAKPTIPSSANAAKDTGLQQPSFGAQTMSQHAGSAGGSSSPEQTRLSQRMTQIIEELKSNQAQLARENAQLAGHLKETQEEMARQDAALASDLKAAQEEMTRDNLSMAAQLKVSQEQIASIREQLKATQEQLNRLVAPKSPRPPRLASPSPPQPNVIQRPKPAPKPQSSQAGGLPKNSTQSPPKQP